MTLKTIATAAKMHMEVFNQLLFNRVQLTNLQKINRELLLLLSMLSVVCFHCFPVDSLQNKDITTTKPIKPR